MNNVLFSHKNEEWVTPDNIFNELNNMYCFTLDACANDKNHKCKKYFTINDNALLQSWKGNIVFCNPPYSKIKEFVKKADYECRINDVTTIMLIPARTDTIWFHEFIYKIYDVKFLKGRLKFSNKDRAPFPSMIVYFRKEY